MGINLGMMGALAGGGAALQSEAEVMRKREDADLEEQRQMRLQQFAAELRDQYAIKADERGWKNEQERAPIKRAMKVEDETAVAQGKLDFATTNRDKLAENTNAEAEAKLTKSGKELAASQTEEHRAKARAADAVTRAYDSGAKGGGSKVDHKMDENDKLLFQDANTRVREAEKEFGKVMTGLTSVDDPAKHPGVLYAKKALSEAKRNQFRVGVQVGVITPERVADDIMGAAKNRDDVMRSLNELGGSVGTAFSDKVAGVLSQNDAWKAMSSRSSGPPQSAAGKAISKAAPGGGAFNEKGDWVPAGSENKKAAPAVAAGMAGPAAKNEPAPTISSDEADLARLDSDPAMRAQLNQENRDINDFKRADLSPEVKDWRAKVQSLKDKVAAAKRANYTRAQYDQGRARAF